jgi:hypothetical protein
MKILCFKLKGDIKFEQYQSSKFTGPFPQADKCSDSCDSSTEQYDNPSTDSTSPQIECSQRNHRAAFDQLGWWVSRQKNPRQDSISKLNVFSLNVFYMFITQ